MFLCVSTAAELLSAHEISAGDTNDIPSVWSAGVAVAISTIPAFAHHSFAMFDGEKTKVLEGTVREFQWTNPHSWIMLTAANAQGRPEQWAIEMGGPGRLTQQGWVPTTLTPGMKVKAIIHPLRDGNNGGQFMAVTLPNGTQLGNPNAALSANAGGANE
jgi:Family of unknown function (DUF6152)